MKEKHKDLYNSWRALVKLKEDMGSKVLELIAHPDSTPEHIAQVMPQYKRVVAMLRDHKPAMVKAMGNYPILSRAIEQTKL